VKGLHSLIADADKIFIFFSIKLNPKKCTTFKINTKKKGIIKIEGEKKEFIHNIEFI
jgi:hypothetical protein